MKELSVFVDESKDFYVYFFGFARIFHGFIINSCNINIKLIAVISILIVIANLQKPIERMYIIDVFYVHFYYN